MNSWNFKGAATIVFALVAHALILPQPAFATSPAPIPYGKFFEEANHVFVAQCLETKLIEEKEKNNGLKISYRKGKFRNKGVFKGVGLEEFFELDYSEAEVVDAEKLKVSNIDPEALIRVISRQPIFEVTQTYIVFISDGEVLTAIKVPTYHAEG